MLPLGKDSETILSTLAWAIDADPTVKFTEVLNVPVEFFTKIFDLLSTVTTDSIVAL